MRLGHADRKRREAALGEERNLGLGILRIGYRGSAIDLSGDALDLLLDRQLERVEETKLLALGRGARALDRESEVLSAKEANRERERERLKRFELRTT